MTNTNTANTDTNTAVLATLELQGADIARQWKSITKGDKARFTQHTQANGFDMQLGKLMVALTEECEGRIKSSRLADCGINIVDKRRRSEAKWFVENEVACREFIAKSKKGFTSLTALQSAMSKADKQASSTDDKASTDKSSKASAKPTEATSEAKPATKDTIFKELLAICKASDVDIMDIAEMLLREADALEDNHKVIKQGTDEWTQSVIASL